MKLLLEKLRYENKAMNLIMKQRGLSTRYNNDS
jgi:hypothetical protein